MKRGEMPFLFAGIKSIFLCMKKFAKLLFLSLASAFLGAMAFPNFLSDSGFPPLAFIFLIPVFHVTREARLSYAWLLGLLHGFLYYLVYNFWLKTFHPLAILIAPTLESIQYLFLFLALSLSAKLFKKRAWIAQALVYSGYLYLTQQGFLAYPYGNLTAAVYKMLPLIQIVDIGGIWLLGFILVVPQALIAEIWSRRRFLEYRVDIVFAALLMLLALIYGTVRINHYENAGSADTVRLVAVQHSADSWKGGDATYRKNFERPSVHEPGKP
jgi:Apolipoprotein N-acyltransferase